MRRMLSHGVKGVMFGPETCDGSPLEHKERELQTPI